MSTADDQPQAAAEAPVVFASVSAALATWRTAHPQATFAEIEAAVEAQLAPLRARLIADALPSDPMPAAAAGRPPCPRCGVAMRDRGQHDRTLLVPGEAPVTLTRTYWTCPGCGEGLFPPG